MQVAIVKYNAGNVFSVINAVKRLGIEPLWTDDAELLAKADRVIFPGQGEASHAMNYLRQRGLDKVICDLKQPVLGICIGQQLMCKHSEEGDTDCLGIFPMEVKKFQPTRHEDKVPQMGWNSISFPKNEKLEIRNEKLEIYNSGIDLFKGVKEGDFVYFVHSYYVPLHEEYTIAKANFTLDYSAAIHKDNFYATQFHPEKSGMVGQKILENFMAIDN
ncbi:MAG: imidazole glycerol phosphate synthase subunit HisH [Prevotella sp.]|nr:imidazole glycerol phosphate synthase subunit HisH [Prevotella sp.]